MNVKSGTPGGTGSSRDRSTNSRPKGNDGGDQQADTCVVSNGTTIETELNKLSETRDEARQARENAEGSFADTEDRLTVLRGVERDYPNTKKAYDAVYPQLVRERDNFTDYLDCEESKLKARLGDGPAAEVNGRVNALYAKTEELEEAVSSAKEHGQSIPLEAHQQAVKDRTAELNAWKNLTATVTAQQAELKKLREEITKARQEGHYGLAYGLVFIAKKKQAAHESGPRLVEPAELHREFHVAGENLAMAQKALATAERNLETDKVALAVATKALEDHRKSAEARLRVDLVDVKPASEGMPTANGGTSSADTGGPAAGGDAPSTGARASSAGGGAPTTAAAGPATAGGAPAADADDQGAVATDKTGDN